MKNHKIVDGKLVQTNKNWSHLKNSQKAWIYEQVKAAHVKYIERSGKLPMKKRKRTVLEAVWECILKREIWIPYGEYIRNTGKMIDRLNRKSPLLNASCKSGGDMDLV